MTPSYIDKTILTDYHTDYQVVHNKLLKILSVCIYYAVCRRRKQQIIGSLSAKVAKTNDFIKMSKFHGTFSRLALFEHKTSISGRQK